jgi:hypothetical protein
MEVLESRRKAPEDRYIDSKMAGPCVLSIVKAKSCNILLTLSLILVRRSCLTPSASSLFMRALLKCDRAMESGRSFADATSRCEGSRSPGQLGLFSIEAILSLNHPGTRLKRIEKVDLGVLESLHEVELQRGPLKPGLTRFRGDP